MRFLVQCFLIFLMALPLSQGQAAAPSAATNGSFAKAYTAFQKGDYETAAHEWQILAQKGWAQAQYNLGYLYNAGLGVAQDPTQAATWMEKAAQQGMTEAQYQLGHLYAYGSKDFERNVEQAKQWLQKAAAQGDTRASIDLQKLNNPSWKDRGQQVINQMTPYIHHYWSEGKTWLEQNIQK